MGYSAMRPENPIFGISLGITSSCHTLVRPVNDPVTVDLEACGATAACIRDSRMLNGARQLDTPLVGSVYEVRTLPRRPV